MKFYKLVKSIDYVTYPSLIELRKINASIGDSISNFQNLILAALIATVLELSTISTWLIAKLAEKWTCQLFINFSQLENAGKILSVAIGIILYLLLFFIRWIRKRCGSNKDTIDEREQLASDFYKVELPHLIAVKSILVQHDTPPSGSPAGKERDNETKYLLLLQAKYELCQLIVSLNNSKIVERDKNGVLTADSSTLLNNIGMDSYTAVIIDVLDCAKDIFTKLEKLVMEKQISETKKSLATTIKASSAIGECLKDTTKFNSVINKYNEIKPLLLND